MRPVAIPAMILTVIRPLGSRLGACSTIASAIKSDLRQIVRSCVMFEASTGDYPRDLEELDSWIQRGGPGSSDLAIRDPWGREYLYANLGDSVRAYTLGKDGVPGGAGESQDYYLDSNRLTADSDWSARNMLERLPLLLAIAGSGLALFAVGWWVGTRRYSMDRSDAAAMPRSG